MKSRKEKELNKIKFIVGIVNHLTTGRSHLVIDKDFLEKFYEKFPGQGTYYGVYHMILKIVIDNPETFSVYGIKADNQFNTWSYGKSKPNPYEDYYLYYNGNMISKRDDGGW